MASILPFVTYLRNKKFSKLAAVLIPYLGIMFIIFLLIVPLVPFFIGQIGSFIVGFPEYLKESGKMFGVSVNSAQIASYLSTQIESIGTNAFTVTTRIFGGLFSVITIIVVSFYLLWYHDSFKQTLAGMFHERQRERILTILQKIEDKLGAWLRGQILLCLAIGIMSWIALSLLGVRFALPLALMAGILEALPTLGPILSAVPAVVVALTQSPALALIVIAAFLVIQALENHILVPNIMQRAVGLNPLIVIVAITIGANLLGFAGALLAIPFVSFVMVLYTTLNQEEVK